MAVLKIYSDIQTEGMKQCASFWGDAEGVCYKDVDEFCESIPEDDKTIDVRLFCDGGVVDEGWAIYDRLRQTDKEITCTVDGKAASMATVILMAAPKERRFAYEHSAILVHNPWSGTMGNADEMQKKADELREIQEKILDLYVERCGCDRDEMQALMNEDKWIDMDRAKELGLIGEIIAPVSAKSRGAVVTNKNNKTMAKNNDKTVEVKASLLDRVLAKMGLKSLDEVVMDMELSTSDGQTLTVEREEGEPQVGDKASPDGEFLMPDGKTIVVADGVITDIKAEGDEGDPEDKAEGDDDPEGDEKDQRIAELEAEVEELKKQLEEAKEAQDKAEAKAKTTEDLRILNAVKMAGGEKALAKISSNYKPQGRQTSGANARNKAEDQDLEMSPMRKEIEARKKGEFKKK